MGTEQSLQERSFRLYIELEAEELRQLCDDLKASNTTVSAEGYLNTLKAIRDFTNKRVAVIKEADALFKATQAAREKVAA